MSDDDLIVRGNRYRKDRGKWMRKPIHTTLVDWRSVGDGWLYEVLNALVETRAERDEAREKVGHVETAAEAMTRRGWTQSDE